MAIFTDRNTLILQRLTFCLDYQLLDINDCMGLLVRHSSKKIPDFYFLWIWHKQSVYWTSKVHDFDYTQVHVWNYGEELVTQREQVK